MQKIKILDYISKNVNVLIITPANALGYCLIRTYEEIMQR